MQAKYKVHDRWGQRQEDVGPGLVKVEENMSRFTNRAARMEWNIAHNKGSIPDIKPKREQFEDDLRREGRGIGRGLEGDFDEELDYDANEDFQDDEDSNTFYVDKGEEEEKKLQEVRPETLVERTAGLTTRNVRSKSTAGQTPRLPSTPMRRTSRTMTTCLAASSTPRASVCAR